MFKRDPYKNNLADAYTTVINILAVEYLVKTDNREEYSRRIKQVYELSELDLEMLYICLSLNTHTSSLGAMIAQGDYDNQRDELLYFLDHPEERAPVMKTEIRYERLVESILEKDPHAFDRVYPVTSKELKNILQQSND